MTRKKTTPKPPVEEAATTSEAPFVDAFSAPLLFEMIQGQLDAVTKGFPILDAANLSVSLLGGQNPVGKPNPKQLSVNFSFSFSEQAT
jgi:hypothetical protein